MVVRSALHPHTAYRCSVWKAWKDGIAYRLPGIRNLIRVIDRQPHRAGSAAIFQAANARQSTRHLLPSKAQMSTTRTQVKDGTTQDATFRPRQTIVSDTQTSMTVTDSLYGTVDIICPVILSLIRDSSFQRLHGIHQHGITPVINVNKVTPSVSRFEHSLGAMLLIHSLVPSDEEQQCAALLHDISHTALSHVTDYAFGYVIHEVEKEAYVQTTKIPQILNSYKMDWKSIISEEQGVWTLLEQSAPLLCADRLDYGLRDMIAFDIVSEDTVRQIVKQFVVHDGRIMCSDIGLAGILARGYLRCDQLAWANPHHSGLYKFAGDAIRLALQHGVIKKDQLWIGTDEQFWNTILGCGIQEIDEMTKYVNEHTKFEVVSKQEIGNVLDLTLKVRTIDPEILVHGGEGILVMRLSQLDERYKREREDYIESKRGAIRLKVS
jgi:uncharacterized protein